MVAFFGACWQAAAASVGFAQLRAADGMKIDVWYPASAPASDNDVGLFTQSVAPNAPVAGEGLGLVVMSHGTGGSAEGHYDTALALAGAGFVVAAVEHPGDNYRDSSKATQVELRPAALKLAVDVMLRDWSGRAAIDPGRIGAFGFSSGAFTVLAAAGGVPDLTRIAPYCATHMWTYVCEVLKAHPVPEGRAALREAWVADPRIRAVVAAAPAIGFTFDRAGLAGVRVPVQLWRAEFDSILPSPDYVEPVRDALPQPPEYRIAQGADHFDFLAPCSDALARVAPAICKSRAGFDREDFHDQFNAVVVAFFLRTLPPH